MSDPVIDKVAQDMKAAINTITIANGFNQDLICVQPIRGKWENESAPENGKVLLRFGPVAPDEENSAEGNPGTQAWRQQFFAIAFILPSDADTTTPLDTFLNKARADIEKKLQEDETRGTNAIDTIPTGAIPFDEGPGFTGIVVVSEVLYRTRRNDPYTQA